MTTLRDALSLMLTEGSTGVLVRGEDGTAKGYLTFEVVSRLLSDTKSEPVSVTLAAMSFAQEPVIPDFGRGDDCIRENGKFCVDWFFDEFGSRFLPRVSEHVQITLIALAIGFAIAFAGALVAYRYERFELPFANVSALFYTIPSIAFFQIMVPITGIGWLSIEIALVS